MVILSFGEVAGAATIVVGAISNLGDDYFVDVASTGGGITDPRFLISIQRNFQVSPTNNVGWNVGPLGTEITLTGIGWASGGELLASQMFPTSMTLSVTYLGADDQRGTADDVDFGTVTDAMVYSGEGTYYWVFDTPLQRVIDGVGGRFEFNFTANDGDDPAFIRFFTTGGSFPPNTKLSIAGNSVAVVPEPGVAWLGMLGMIGLLARRARV